MVKAQPKNGKRKSARPKISRKSSRPVQSQVQRPLAAGTVIRTQRQPSQRTLPDGSVIVRHRELMSDVACGGAHFGVQYYTPINAGASTFARWLAGVANRYESYLIDSLTVEFTPNVPGTYSGRFYLSVDYDPDDLTASGYPTNAAQLLITPGATTGPIYGQSRFVARSVDLHKRKTYFVRDGINGGGSISSAARELRSFDVGNLYFATSGVYDGAGNAFTGLAGQLWVEYSVRLMTPQLQEPELLADTELRVLSTITANNSYTLRQSSYASGVVGPTVPLNRYDTNFLGNHAAGTAPVPLVDSDVIMCVRGLVQPQDPNGSVPALSNGNAVIEPTSDPTDTILLTSYIGNANMGHMLYANATVGTWVAEAWYRVKRTALQAIDWYVTFSEALGTANVVVDLVAEIFSVEPAVLKVLTTAFSNFLNLPVIFKQSGPITAAAPIGTSTSGPARPHPDTGFSFDGTEITIPPGAWRVWYYVAGTGLADPGLSLPGATLNSMSHSVVNAASTELVFTDLVWNTTETQWEIGITATTITDAYICFSPWGDERSANATTIEL